MPMSTMLVILRSAAGSRRPSSGGTAPGQSPMRSRASRIWPTISCAREVAHQALRAGVAERAGQRAADLARDAQRAALGLGDVDGLDLGRLALAPLRRQPQQPLARAVDRHLLADDLRPRQRIALGEVGAQLLGDVGHGVEVGHAAHVQPAPQLVDAHAQLLVRHPGAPPAPRAAPRGRGRRAKAFQRVGQRLQWQQAYRA